VSSDYGWFLKDQEEAMILLERRREEVVRAKI
jgi:hypothetical protein